MKKRSTKHKVKVKKVKVKIISNIKANNSTVNIPHILLYEVYFTPHNERKLSSFIQSLTSCSVAVLSIGGEGMPLFTRKRYVMDDTPVWSFTDVTITSSLRPSNSGHSPETLAKK